IRTTRISAISQADSMLKANLAAQAKRMLKYAINQESSQKGFTEWSELSAFNPLAIARRFEALEVKARKKGKEEQSEKAEHHEKILEIQRAEEVSEQYERKNPELKARILLLLKVRLSQDDTVEDILKKVLEAYRDYYLADEALDFLLETSEEAFIDRLREAKEELSRLYGREIRAGRNISTQAQEFSRQGLGSPTALRDMYRDVTGNPRDPGILFEELNKNFPYDRMKSVIDFLLHSLGADLKSKGPSIARAELHRLMTETRTLQAILGVYRFFKSRMRLLSRAFKRRGLLMPSRFTFEELAKQFMKFVQERYPSSEKVLYLAASLGISEELIAKIITYTQFRDAVRGVAPKLFRSEQHRQDVLMTFIETIEELDEKLEEEEESKEKKKEKDNG
ncbi:MAG: type III secretion system gatekeeper subunit SctW, partial [Anaerolineae bacterium]